MPRELAAVAVGLAVWAVATAAAYALAGPARTVALAAGRCARRWTIGTPGPRLCAATSRTGPFQLACHLPAGHDVALIHYDRSADKRWAATPRGNVVLGAGLRVR
jgi:hypothetical protein